MNTLIVVIGVWADHAAGGGTPAAILALQQRWQGNRQQRINVADETQGVISLVSATRCQREADRCAPCFANFLHYGKTCSAGLAKSSMRCCQVGADFAYCHGIWEPTTVGINAGCYRRYCVRHCACSMEQYGRRRSR